MTLYTWQLVFDRMDDKGPERIVALFKLALKEFPRLERMFLNSSPQEHVQARQEIIALFHRLDLEMKQAIIDSPLPEQEFIREVKKANNFTSEEWEQLQRLPSLLQQHGQELYNPPKAFKPLKKTKPHFKA